MPFSRETLASYRIRVLREVRDAQQQYFNAQTGQQGTTASFADIDDFINRSLQWRDLYTKGSRSYRAAVPLTTNLDQYDLTTLFPNDTVLDIATLYLLYGTWRVRLDERPFSEVTDVWRSWLNYVNVPGAYCRYGATGLFIATAPGTQYAVDFDVVTLSVAMADTPQTPPGGAVNTDPLPYPYTEPVVKHAAHLAEQFRDREEIAQKRFNEALRAVEDIEGSRVGQLPQAYLSPRGNRL